MRKFYVLWLALVAMLAFGAAIATSAFAVSQILWSNETVLVLLELLAAGFVLFEDKSAGASNAAILCSFKFDINLEPGGTLGFITELLMLTTNDLLRPDGTVGTATDGEPDMLDCEGEKTCTGTENLVTVLNLPWHIEIELNGAAYLVDFLEEAGKIPTYAVDCNTILGLIEDTCEGLTSARLYTDAAGNLRFSFNGLALTEPDIWAANSELTHCSIGGPGTGIFESENEAGTADAETSGGIITHVTGGSLTLSDV
jgi:hypothetical protein